MDSLFVAEFGQDLLASLLWRAGLRVQEQRGSIVHLLDVETNGALHRSLLRDGVNNSNIGALVDDAQKLWADDSRLKRACTVTRYTPNVGGIESNLSPQPLVKNLLGIDSLQPALLTFLVHKISEVSEQNIDLARLLLSQMKWLDYLVDSKALCETLLAIIDIVCPTMQRDIIESLPEILDDACRFTASEALVQLLETNHSMLSTIVDALGALGVDDSRAESINGAVLAALSAAEPSMLPVTVRYLIKTCPPNMLSQTMNVVRQNIALSSMGPDSGKICFQAVRTGFRARRDAASEALRMIKNLPADQSLRPADIWILLALLDDPCNRRHAESLFLKKVASSQISRHAIEAAVSPFLPGLMDQMTLLTCLASACLKVGEPNARSIAGDIFSTVFRLSAVGSSCRRDVLHSLLEHAGSRRDFEVEAALDVFVQIAHEGERDSSLVPYSATLFGLLDYLELYTDDQIRKIWTLLGLVCRSNGHFSSASTDSSLSSATSRRRKRSSQARSRSSIASPSQTQTVFSHDVSKASAPKWIQDDFGLCSADQWQDKGCDAMNADLLTAENDAQDSGHLRMRSSQSRSQIAPAASQNSELESLIIVLRKELTHTESKFRHIGVVGLCTLIRVLQNNLPRSILRLFFEVGLSNPSTESNAYHELARNFAKDDTVSATTLKTLFKRISGSFENRFIANANEVGDKVEDSQLSHELWFNLDGPEPDLCVPISRYLLGQMSEPKETLCVMSSQLSLLCAITKLRDDGSLSEIDAVIGCPLRLPASSVVDSFRSLSGDKQLLILEALVSGYSWLIELLNAFASQNLPELRAKCIKRLEHILELRKIICSCIAEVPEWKSICQLPAKNSPSHYGPLNPSSIVEALIQRYGPFDEGIDGQAYSTTIPKSPLNGLSSSALDLLGATSPVSWTVLHNSLASSMPSEQASSTETVNLSGRCLQHLLAELVYKIEHVFSSSSPRFGYMKHVIFGGAKRPSLLSNNAAKSFQSVTTTIRTLQDLRVPLMTINSHLAACFQQVQEGMTENLDPSRDDTDQHCIVLCLRAYTSIAYNISVGNHLPRQLLFEIFASMNFSSNKIIPEASVPLTEQDVCIASRKSFLELWSNFGALSGLDMHDLEQSDLASDHQESRANCMYVFERSSVLLAALDATARSFSVQDRSEYGRYMSDAASSLLESRWDDRVLSSRKAYLVFPGIIALYIQRSPDLVEAVRVSRRNIAAAVQNSAFSDRESVPEPCAVPGRIEQENDPLPPKEHSNGNWPFLRQKLISVAYAALLDQIIDIIRKFRPSDEMQRSSIYSRMSKIVLEFQLAIELVRTQESLVGSAMRAGRAFVEFFTRNYLPFLKNNFKQDYATVVPILKGQQKATRLLQSLCSHGKSLRDPSLTAIVPSLRKALELLLYKVKDVLVSHSKNQAFTVADLKNRNIQGDVVSAEEQYNNHADVSDGESTDSDSEEANGRSNQNISEGVQRLSRDAKKAVERLGLARRIDENHGSETTQKIADGENQPSTANGLSRARLDLSTTCETMRSLDAQSRKDRSEISENATLSNCKVNRCSRDTNDSSNSSSSESESPRIRRKPRRRNPETAVPTCFVDDATELDNESVAVSEHVPSSRRKTASGGNEFARKRTQSSTTAPRHEERKRRRTNRPRLDVFIDDEAEVDDDHDDEDELPLSLAEFLVDDDESVSSEHEEDF